MTARTALALIAGAGSVAGATFSITGRHAAAAVVWLLVFIAFVGIKADGRNRDGKGAGR